MRLFGVNPLVKERVWRKHNRKMLEFVFSAGKQRRFWLERYSYHVARRDGATFVTAVWAVAYWRRYGAFPNCLQQKGDNS